MFPHHPTFGKWLIVRSVSIISLLILNCFPGAAGQTLNVLEVVRHARTEVAHYTQEFRNLLAKETRTFRIYDKNAGLKKQRIIVSNFLVYDLSKAEGQITEFRNVLSVDSKPVVNLEERAVELFEKVSKASTTFKELDRIQNESLRYDEEIRLFGLTLFQAIALNERIADVMNFTLSGKSRIGNTEVYELRYAQTKESPLIRAGKTGLVVGAVLDYVFESGSNDPRISGTLWIDAKTFQIVREERVLTVQPKGFITPAILTSNEFEFDESKFGIRTPKRISHVEYRVDKNLAAAKHIEIIFEYSEFTRPDVVVTQEKRPN
jgi:hypothetical protein